MSANGTQPRKAVVCRMHHNVVHWEYGGDTTIELYDHYYGGAGYCKYKARAGNGNACRLELVETSGASHGMHAQFGAAVDIGSDYSSADNYYIPVEVTCDQYRNIKVVISTTAPVLTWGTTTASDYSGVSFAPSISYTNVSFPGYRTPKLNPKLTGGTVTDTNPTAEYLWPTTMAIHTAKRNDGSTILNSSGEMMNVAELAINHSTAGTHGLYVKDKTTYLKGDVGIGTVPTSDYKLNVNGVAKVEDYLWVKGGIKDDGGDYGSDGQVLSTNGNGQVHWENLTWEDLPNVSSLSALP